MRSSGSHAASRNSTFFSWKSRSIRSILKACCGSGMRCICRVAAGERLYMRYGFRRLFELRAADIVQPDLGNSGGIMETKKIAAMAEAFDMRIQPHLCAGPVLTASTLQLDACLTN